MKPINKLNGRERRYYMWKLMYMALDRFEAKDRRRRDKKRAPTTPTQETLEVLDFDLPSLTAHPLR